MSEKIVTFINVPVEKYKNNMNHIYSEWHFDKYPDWLNELWRNGKFEIWFEKKLGIYIILFDKKYSYLPGTEIEKYNNKIIVKGDLVNVQDGLNIFQIS